MVQPRQQRRRIAIAGSVFGAVVFLAIGLNSFELASGLRIRNTERAEFIEETLAERRIAGRNWLSGRALARFVSVGLALAVVLLLVAQSRRENRILAAVLIFLLGLMVILFAVLPRNDIQQPPELVEDDPDLIGQGAIGIEEELPEEDAVDVSVPRSDSTDPAIWVVTGVAAIGLLIVLRPRLPRKLRKTQGQTSEEKRAQKAEEELARTADEAVAAGASGAVLAVVIRCYRDMLEVYKNNHYVGRPQGLTPREFAERLISAGVTRDHANDLTELFERARYGEITLTAEEERRALACLRGISDALQR